MSSTFTAVDLSRLPVPDIVEQLDFEQVFNSMLTQVRELHPAFTAVTEADPVYALVQAFAMRELTNRQRNNDACRAVMLAYAAGADLEQLGAVFGVARLQLDPGDPHQGVPPTFESDTELRRRIQLAPEGFSVAGPEGAYIFHALSADPRVLDASATSPSPGVVVVSVLSREGDGAASPELLARVEAKLTADDVRPLTDQVLVQSATINAFQVEAVIYTFSGPDAQVVIAESTARIEQHVGESHRLGRDITRSGLFAALHSPGVQRVDLIQPASDIVIDRTRATFCTGIAISNGGEGE